MPKQPPHVRLIRCAAGAVVLALASNAAWAQEPAGSGAASPSADLAPGRPAPEDGQSGYVVYQPARASKPAPFVIPPGSTLEEQQAISFGEFRELLQDPEVRALMEAKVRGEKITLETPSITPGQRAALGALAAWNERWRGLPPMPPPPPPPPPPLPPGW